MLENNCSKKYETIFAAFCNDPKTLLSEKLISNSFENFCTTTKSKIRFSFGKEKFQIMNSSKIKKKVDATVVYLEPLPQPIGHNVNYELFEKMVKILFGNRRKMIENAFKLNLIKDPKLCSDFFELLKNNQIDIRSRAQQLTIEQFTLITKLYSSLMQVNGKTINIDLPSFEDQQFSNYVDENEDNDEEIY